MGIEVAWDRDDSRIVVVVFEGRWTMQDYYTAGEQVLALAESCPQAVGVLMDFSASPQLPRHFVRHAATLVESTAPVPHENVVIYALWGVSPVIRAMYHAFFRVFGAPDLCQRVPLADDEAEARALIAACLARADRAGAGEAALAGAAAD